jgi:hypothetical protein
VPVAGRLREHGDITGLRSRHARRPPPPSPRRPRVRPRRLPSP